LYQVPKAQVQVPVPELQVQVLRSQVQVPIIPDQVQPPSAGAREQRQWLWGYLNLVGFSLSYMCLSIIICLPTVAIYLQNEFSI